MRAIKHAKTRTSHFSFRFTKTELIALIGLDLFLLLTFIAILLYPQYHFFSQNLSELGIGSTALLFNAGIIILGASLIPIFMSHYQKNNFLNQLVCFLGEISAIFLIGTGIFTISTPYAHLFFASMFFITTAFLILAAYLSFNRNEKLQKSCNFTIRFTFSFVTSIAITVIACYLVVQAPAWQKLAVLCIIIWAFDWLLIRKIRE